MQIDLSQFRDVRVDPSARTARVTGRSLLGLLDHEAMAHDLVVPMGTVSHTGVGGLVTGGGFGCLAQHFGLSVDNLLAVDVVTADGELRHASADENPDLFWGVRGGGGNFGIVTSFEFRLHPMQRQILGGAIMFPMSMARDVLTLYGDYGPEQPDELQLDLVMAFVTGIPTGLVDALVEGFEGHPDRTTQVVFQQSGGRIARVASDATAFVQRDAVANMLPSVGWASGSTAMMATPTPPKRPWRRTTERTWRGSRR